MNREEILYKRLKDIKDYWVKTAVDGLNQEDGMIWSDCATEYSVLRKSLENDMEQEAYRAVLDEIISGAFHSILVMLDGGDELTDTFNIDLIDADTGKSLKETGSLNESFIEYLLNSEE